MKNYIIITIAILSALTTGFIFGRYTSDSGRYSFRFSGDNSSLFDTRTGDLYQVENGKVFLVNYKDYVQNPKKN